MAASYPNNARTFRNPTGSTTAVTSGGVDQHAADHTAVEEEVAAISSDLRTAKGVTANMAAKISAMDASIASAYVAGGTDVPIADGGTGASTAANARTNLGLGTAATKDIPAAGDASATQVVYGTDTRLTNARTPTGSVTSGDLTGSYPSPTIAKLQGNTVAAASPTSGQVLSWNSTLSQWEPSTVSGAGSITGSFPYIFVASSTATAAQKAAAGATYTCDGTNDEVQIAAALAALPASGGEVVLSPGTFYIGAANAITIPSNSSLRGTGGGLWGSDSGTVLKYATGAAAPAAPAVGNNYLVSAMIRCLGTSSQNRVNGQRIQDLGLDGSDKANLVGIYMHYVNVFHIDTLQLWAFPSFGIYFHGASDGTVKRVRFDYCGSTDGRTTGIYKGAMEFNDDATVTFTITAANVVAGDIYQTSNGAQFRVISSGTGVTSVATAPIGSPPTAAPSTLTRVSGTGPASLSYSAFSTTSDWANDNIIVESCWWEQCKDRAVQVRSGNTLGGQAGSDLGYSISFLNCKFENSSNNPRGGTSHSYIRISGAGVRILNSYFFVGDLLNNSLTEQLRAIILAESY